MDSSPLNRLCVSSKALEYAPGSEMRSTIPLVVQIALALALGSRPGEGRGDAGAEPRGASLPHVALEQD